MSVTLPPASIAGTVVVPLSEVQLPDAVRAALSAQRAADPKRLSDTHVAFESVDARAVVRCATITEEIDADVAAGRTQRFASAEEFDRWLDADEPGE